MGNDKGIFETRQIAPQSTIEALAMGNDFFPLRFRMPLNWILAQIFPNTVGGVSNVRSRIKCAE